MQRRVPEGLPDPLVVMDPAGPATPRADHVSTKPPEGSKPNVRVLVGIAESEGSKLHLGVHVSTEKSEGNKPHIESYLRMRA